MTHKVWISLAIKNLLVIFWCNLSQLLVLGEGSTGQKKIHSTQSLQLCPAT